MTRGHGVGRIARIRIVIRDANSDDLNDVVGLWEMLAQHHEELSDQFALAWDGRRKWAKYLEVRFSEISTKLIVAEEEEEIVGFMLCLLSPNAPVFKDRKIGVISDVYVLEERRRKGVAKNMLNHAIKWFEKNKVRSIQLGVAHDNFEARAAWRQVGFKPYIIYKRLDLKKLHEKERTAPKRVRKVTRQKNIKRKRGL